MSAESQKGHYSRWLEQCERAAALSKETDGPIVFEIWMPALAGRGKDLVATKVDVVTDPKTGLDKRDINVESIPAFLVPRPSQ